MKMTYEEAIDIIQNDPDYLDVTKWKEKHHVAMLTYFKYECGMTNKELKKVKKTMKKAIKEIKEKRKNAIQFLRTGSNGSSKEDA